MLIERFSQLTTEAIARFDDRTAMAYLEFMNQQLRLGDTDVQKIIDVYFVESLMWNINDKKRKQWGWSLIPEPMKTLYVAMWGNPDFT